MRKPTKNLVIKDGDKIYTFTPEQQIETVKWFENFTGKSIREHKKEWKKLNFNLPK